MTTATIHDTDHHADSRAELSRQPTRVRERGMRCFGIPEHAAILERPRNRVQPVQSAAPAASGWRVSTVGGAIPV